MFNLRTDVDLEIRNDHGQVVAVVSISKIGLLLGEIKLKGCLHRPDSVSILLVFVKDKVTKPLTRSNLVKGYVYQLLRIPYMSSGTCRIMDVFYTYSNCLNPIEFDRFGLL